MKLQNLAVLALLAIGSGAARAQPTLTTIDDLAPTGFTTSIAIGADDLPVISYLWVFNSSLKVAHCSLPGCSDVPTNTITVVEGPNAVGFYTAIAIGNDGLPVVSYQTGGLRLAHCSLPGCTDTAMNTISTLDADGGTYNSIAIGADGNPVISHYEPTSRELRIVHCSLPDCSATASNTSTAVASGVFTSLAIGADGLPIVSYRDTSDLSLGVVHCSLADCSDTVNNTTTTLDSTVTVRFTSIAIGSDGLPVIAYWDSGGDDLRVAHCSLPDCSDPGTNSLSVVDTSAGSNSAIAIGSDGLPVISYRDGDNTSLKVVHCGGEDCADPAQNVISTIDEVGDIGYFTSIAVGVDGLPVISYYDQTAGSLKVAHCATPSCSSLFVDGFESGDVSGWSAAVP